MNELSKGLWNNLKVMVVDDIETIHTVFTKELEKIGICSITHSYCITSAYEELKNSYKINSPFHIIFSDWIMPNGTGEELLNKIRNKNNHIDLRYTKFVMVTGKEDKTKQAIDAGANSVIKKPFTAEIIHEKLMEIFYSPFKI